jgi:hypothetical protein
MIYSSGSYDYEIFSVSDLFLWGIAVAILFFCAMRYLSIGRNKENLREKLLMIGFSGMFFGLVLMRVFFFLRDLQVSGQFINHTFYGDYDNTLPLYFILLRITYISGMAGFLSFILLYEISTKRTKYILSLTNVFFMISLILLPDKLLGTYVLVFIALDILLLLFILFSFTQSSQLEFKAVASVMIIGLIIFAIGHLLGSAFSKKNDIFPLEIAPILYIVGTLIAISPTYIDPKYFSNAILFWVLSLGIIAIAITFTIAYVILFEFQILFMPITWIILCPVIPMIIYFFYRIIKTIKSQEIATTKEERKDFLKLFTKPQNLTEKEVALYKEQKICLVCKNKVSRLLFICPECDVIYCQKCSIVLSNIENVCWVCNTAIDESKPSKPLEKIDGTSEIIVMNSGNNEKKSIK